MTHRKRVLAALERRPTDRTPFAMLCGRINPPALQALEAHVRGERGTTVAAILDNLEDVFVADPFYRADCWRGRPLGPGEDVWGVVREEQSYGDGAYEEIRIHPLADATLADIAAYPMPRVSDFEPDPFLADVAAHPDHALMIVGGNPFEQTWYLRGLEQNFEDLLLEPELFHALADRVTTSFEEILRWKLSLLGHRVDLVFSADDIAGQRGLLMSLDHFREHLRPYHERLNRIAHEAGARVVYHTDGGCSEAVPDLIEMGIDVLQALQFDAEPLEPTDLKRRFGDRLAFAGGVSVQKTLPFGSPDEVRQEVRDRVRVLGEGGGYLLGPSHAIQAGTPPESILAFLDAACEARASGA